MKKIISGSALLTAAMLIAPNPFDVTPNPGTAGTTVEFSVDPAYTLTKSGDNLVLHVKAINSLSEYDYDLTVDTVNNTYTVSRDSIYGTPITLTNWKYGDTDLASLLTKV